MVKVKVKNKYITQEIELTHPLDNLNLMVKDETTELIVKLNYEELPGNYEVNSGAPEKNFHSFLGRQEKLLDLTNFDNLTKLVIVDIFNKNKKTLYDWVGKVCSGSNLLNIISSSIKKVYCIGSNISYIECLPTSLTHLRCSSNNIMGIKYLPSTLEILELSNCGLGKNNISLYQFYLPNLKILNINSNNLCLDVDKFISPLDTLKILKLSNNKFTNINILYELMPNLEILKCSNNQLTENSFVNLPPGLKILDCSHNHIKSLENLPTGIEILDCSYNELESLDYLLSSIVRLNCSHNQITQIYNLPCLMEYLTISSNPIVELENLPSSITYLKICGCNKFKNKISNPPKMLEKVIIINNNTETLNGYNFANLANLPKIKSVIVKRHCPYGVVGNYCNCTQNLIK